MAERSIVQILLRASGGRSVATETGQATGGLRRLDRAATGAGRSMRGVASAAGVAGAAMGYGLYRGAKASVMAFAEAEKVGAQTRAVLESTGHAAGQSARQIEDRANALSRMSGQDDEAIQSAQNMLLTFRDIRGQAFGPATEAALDMSSAFTAMGKSMSVQDAALQLGKALNDPTKGMSRLQRIGVTFTDAQKEQAATLVENGDLLGAQRIILRELSKEFGGSAKAAGQTTAGAMDRLKVSVENAQEAIGLGLAPAVGLAADKMDDLVQGAIPGLTRLSTKISDVFGRDDLDLAGKIAVSAREIRTAGEPVVDSLIVGLKNAQLDDKLGDAIEWAAPKLADGAARAAPAAAEAFVNAWMDAGPWGKLLGALVVAKSASKALGGFGPWGVGGPLAAGSLRNPIAVVTAGAPGGLPGGKGGKKGVPGGPSWLRRAAPKAAKLGGAAGIIGGALALPDAISTEQDLEPGEADIYRRNNQAALERARRRPQTRMPSIEFHGFMPVVVNVDGEPVAKANAKVQGRVRARDRR